ncbi:OX-2 membrane glycoprotein-like [Embiotoca jacksoni]|uniref:OX-2 membrane glycoprotein-like n=1 Tax=Embiotoca jacksoni TaxID=100190 RepID=UPI003704558B
MEESAVLYFFYVLGIFSKGLTPFIQTQHTVVGKMGDEVILNCQIIESKDVQQVTWMKNLPEGETNVGSNHKDLGQLVYFQFRGKVEFEDVGLLNTSIVIRNVTELDEGCYRCLFHIYPDPAVIGTTCLQLYELHEPVLHVRESNSSEELVVSCSATGRPAPTVTLNVSPQDLHLSPNNTVSVSNTNGTVTVTTTAVLSGVHKHGAQVGCAVRVLSAPQRNVSVTIPDVKPVKFTPAHRESSWIIGLVVGMVIVCCLVSVFIFVLMKQKKLNRNKTPQKPAQDIDENKTPLMIKMNEIRPRSSVKKP